MKKQFLLLAGVAFTATTLFGQQVQNGGFEDWASVNNPDHWQTLATLINPIAAPLATQDQTTFAEGASSVKLTTTFIPGAGTIPGTVLLGEDAGINPYFYGGVPFTLQPDTFFFSYKYTPVNPLDSASVDIYFWKGGQPTPQASVVNGGSVSLANTSGQWLNVYLPLTSSWSGVPDSLFITFSSSKDTASINVGAVLNVDAVSFGYTNTPPSVTLSVNPTTVAEGGTAAFTATLSAAAASDITVNVGIPTGTATAGTDYTANLSTPTVTIPAGQTSATVNVQALTDATVEGSETVIITLAAGAGYTLGTPSTATLTITDPTGINETGAMKAISLYPNPASSVVNVVIPSEVAAQNIVISDVTGKAIKTVNNVSGTKVIGLDGLATGNYVVTFSDASTKAITGSKQLQVSK